MAVTALFVGFLTIHLANSADDCLANPRLPDIDYPPPGMDNKPALPPSAPMQGSGASREIAHDSGKTAAPAPSPKSSTLVFRSFQSMMEDSFSGTNHEDRLVSSRHDELLSNFQGINKTRACSFQIKRGGVSRTNVVLNQTSSTRGMAYQA